jgi:hypothetical protein
MGIETLKIVDCGVRIAPPIEAWRLLASIESGDYFRRLRIAVCCEQTIGKQQLANNNRQTTIGKQQSANNNRQTTIGNYNRQLQSAITISNYNQQLQSAITISNYNPQLQSAITSRHCNPQSTVANLQ